MKNLRVKVHRHMWYSMNSLSHSHCPEGRLYIPLLCFLGHCNDSVASVYGLFDLSLSILLLSLSFSDVGFFTLECLS
jgi:hypothetical protein